MFSIVILTNHILFALHLMQHGWSCDLVPLGHHVLGHTVGHGHIACILPPSFRR